MYRGLVQASMLPEQRVRAKRRATRYSPRLTEGSRIRIRGDCTNGDALGVVVGPKARLNPTGIDGDVDGSWREGEGDQL